jgi:hypothetical protein
MPDRFYGMRGVPTIVGDAFDLGASGSQNTPTPKVFSTTTTQYFEAWLTKNERAEGSL